MINVKQGKRHYYVPTWAFFAIHVIVGLLWGLVALGLTSVLPGKVVTVMLVIWCAVYVIAGILRKRVIPKTKVRNMFAGKIGHMWQTYAKMAHADNPDMPLNAENFRQFVMNRHYFDIRDES